MEFLISRLQLKYNDFLKTELDKYPNFIPYFWYIDTLVKWAIS